MKPAVASIMWYSAKRDLIRRVMLVEFTFHKIMGV